MQINWFLLNWHISIFIWSVFKGLVRFLDKVNKGQFVVVVNFLNDWTINKNDNGNHSFSLNSMLNTLYYFLPVKLSLTIWNSTSVLLNEKAGHVNINQWKDDPPNLPIYPMEKCKHNPMNGKWCLKYDLEFERKTLCWVIGICLVLLQSTS